MSPLLRRVWLHAGCAPSAAEHAPLTRAIVARTPASSEQRKLQALTTQRPLWVGLRRRADEWATPKHATRQHPTLRTARQSPMRQQTRARGTQPSLRLLRFCAHKTLAECPPERCKTTSGVARQHTRIIGHLLLTDGSPTHSRRTPSHSPSISATTASRQRLGMRSVRKDWQAQIRLWLSADRRDPPVATGMSPVSAKAAIRGSGQIWGA